MTTILDPSDAKADNAQLQLCSEILSFNVFPAVSKTCKAIKVWFITVLEDNQLPHSVLKYRVPHGSQCVMDRLVHTGLSS